MIKDFAIHSPGWLQFAYIANIMILVPVCWSLFVSGSVSGVFEGKVAESDGLRLLVGSLYLAILTGSFAGLAWPAFFAPLLIVQVFYKACWLLVYILPLYLSGEAFPLGIATTFVAIVASYPVFLMMALR